ncbi:MULTISPECIES: Scr1 family TA system antitoxin-like transcriptional regulator [unclassified Streptomyces]|uniref:Scr1 family TA system antitoxin-like transcriptional regulator n=1 Tax=unclassified Streptomyces TaxID=2593676 RepID=UPI0037F8D5AF
MTGEVTQPPMAWRYCGNQVKLWREQAGVTRERLADEAGYGIETVRSMELGRRRPMLRLLQVADHLCGAGGKLVAAQEFLKPEKFPERTREFMQAEAEAVALYGCEPLLIPGLLQTEAYVRALIGNSCPPLDDETIEERVTARMARQERLRRKPTVLFGFVIYEAALHSGVGGPEVMRSRMHHLLAVGAMRNVAVQVLPVDRAAYPALSGSLVLLETEDHEHYETSALYSEPARVSTLSQRHGIIRMQALGVEESAQFIGRVAEAM